MNRIKFLREEKDLYQKDVAEILGIDRSTYSSYEIGRDTIPLKHLNTLCNYFDISIDYAMGLTKVPKYNDSKDSIDMEKVSTRLKDIRKENNLTQVAISEILNTSRSTWTGYESKKFLISTLLLYEISRRYNYSMDYILGKIDNPVKLK
jgi:transcriptional regulator with XRE-family HTH domain